MFHFEAGVDKHAFDASSKVQSDSKIIGNTGEEKNEEIFFYKRGKLFYFSAGEWKEKGVGYIQIIFSRRLKTAFLKITKQNCFKTCLVPTYYVHQCISSCMKIHSFQNSDKAFSWFAENDPRYEHLCICFKTVDNAAAFKAAFEKVLNILKENEVENITNPIIKSATSIYPVTHESYGTQLLPKADSWTCPICCANNAADKFICVSCETKKPASQITSSNSIATITSSKNSNANLFTFDINEAYSVSSVKSTFSGFTFCTNSVAKVVKSAVTSKPITSSSGNSAAYWWFTFGENSAVFAPIINQSNAFDGLTFSTGPMRKNRKTVSARRSLATSTSNSTAKLFSFSQNSALISSVNEQRNISQSPMFTDLMIKETKTDTKDRETLVASTKSENSQASSYFGFSSMSSYATVVTSPLAGLKPICRNQSAVTTGRSRASTENNISKMNSVLPNINLVDTFYSRSSESRESLATSSNYNVCDSKCASASNISVYSLPLHSNVSLEGQKISSNIINDFAYKFGTAAEVKPIVSLPALIEVKPTEEEETLFGEQAKLLRFDFDEKEWKKYCTAELKILYLKARKMGRILMQTGKVCTNHYIFPHMQLTPLANNNEAWIWCAEDVSDGELKKEMFAAKFKNTEIAQEFFKIFHTCQSKMNEITGENKMPLDDKFQLSAYTGNKKAFDGQPSTYTEKASPGLLGSIKNSSRGFLSEIKPVTQSTTLPLFGLSSISEASATVGFKPSSASNVSAALGGLTQESKISEIKSVPKPLVTYFSESSASISRFNLGLSASSKMSDASLFGNVERPQGCEFQFYDGRFHGNEKTLMASVPTPSSTDDDEEDSFDKCFPPAVPLPPEAGDNSVNEIEEVTFYGRGILFSFSDGDWEKRGTGNIKICIYRLTEKAPRLLMYEERVPNLCADHHFTSNMELHGLKKTDRVFTWLARVRIGEERRLQHFCVRFRTITIAAAFKTAFEEALKIAKENEAKVKFTTNASCVIHKPFEFKLLPKSGPRTCPTCYINNAADKLLCVACETKKPGSEVTAGFNSIFVTTGTNSSAGTSCDNDNAGSPGIDSHDLEKEAMGDFKPLIPLPAEIVVDTEEENEVVLFEDGAKLYRFVDWEWKEYGIGTVKILHHEESGRVRLLMRRDQTLEVCVNHCITPNMEIHSLENSYKAWTWVAQGFADEELRSQHFCIRFKTADIVAAFKAAFEKALNIAKENEAKKVAGPSIKSTTNASPATQKPFGIKFLPKAGSWTCSTCYVSNAADKLLCVACETKKPGSQVTADSHSISITTSISNSTGNQFTFVTNSITITSLSTPKNTFGGFTFSTCPMIQETKTDIEDREILGVSTKSESSPQVTKIALPKHSPFFGFSFKTPPIAVVSSSSTLRSVESTENSAAAADNNISKMHSMLQTITPDNVFGSKSTEGAATFPSFSISVSKSSMELIVPTTSVSPFVNVSAEESGLSTDAADGASEEFVPTAEFKPIVPLPALVAVKTGEEGEEKLFGERAKLFCYDPEGKEWKKRGTGELKILFLKDYKKYRILMRREQVLKICANHSILPDMNWVWFAQDFSDGDLKKEQFTAKFKTKEIAQEFFKVFQKCQSNLKEIANKKEKPEIDKSQSDTCTENKTAFDELFKPEIDKSQSDACTGNKTAYDELFKPVANSWECSKCKKSNMNESSCVYCSTPKSGTSVVIGKSCLVSKQKPLSELFKLRKSSWKCKVCYLRNKSCDAECVSCNSPKPSSSDTFNKNAISSNQDTQPISYVKNNKSETLTNLFKPLAGSWQWQSCLIQNNSDADKCAACETKKPGSFGTWKFASSTLPSPSDFGKFQFCSSVQNASSTEKTSPFSFGSNKPSSGDFGMKPITQSTTFSFGLSSVVGEGSEIVGFKPTLPTSNIPSVFGWTTQKSDLSEKKSFTIPQTTSAPTDAFGNATSTFILNSGSPARKEADSSSVEFRFGSTAKFEYNFSGVRPRSSTKTPVSPKLLSTPSDVDEGDSFDADNPYFQPVIPLPPKVDVKTGEENEEVMFCKRTKLFRFSDGEWKERGMGDIKILFDRNSKKARLLMRRDQVLKVCLNHHLTKDIVFEWRGEKSLTWAVTDFSENEASPELFAIQFKTSELAQQFKDSIDDALKLNALVSESEVSSEQTSTATKVIPNFSFKSNSSVKTESPFSAGSLSACFGTTLQGKSLFGNSASVLGATETKPSSSVSPFFQTDKHGTNSVFGKNLNFTSSSSKSIFGGHGFKFGLGSDAVDKKQVDKDSEIEIVYEATASPEKIAEAEKLKLARNFYLYESKPPCKGCRGCTDTISYKAS